MMKMVLIVIAIFAVTAIVAFAALSGNLGGANGNANHSNMNGTALTVGGGQGKSYLSQAEMQALFGPGTYFSSGDANATSLGVIISANSSNYPTTAFLNNNVSAYWQVVYNITGAELLINGTYASPTVLEQVFQTPVPEFVYSKVLSAIGGTFNVTNTTYGGMTYSYARQAAMNGTAFMVAYKGSEVSIVYVVGKPTSISALAAALAGDMP